MKNIVCFSSGGPNNFATVLEFCAEPRNGARVIALVADRENIPAIEVAQRNDIAYRVFNFSPMGGRDPAVSRAQRERECAPVLAYLEALEARHGSIDLIVLAFRRLLAGEILARFSGRIINVHPADLSVHDRRLRARRYAGIAGLRLSLQDGNVDTRTSIHYVDHGVDTGRLLCLGPRVAPQTGATDDGAVRRHEQVQKALSDRPALLAVLKQLIVVGDDRMVIL